MHNFNEINPESLRQDSLIQEKARRCHVWLEGIPLPENKNNPENAVEVIQTVKKAKVRLILDSMMLKKPLSTSAMCKNNTIRYSLDKKIDLLCRWRRCKKKFDLIEELRSHIAEHLNHSSTTKTVKGVFTYCCNWSGCDFSNTKKDFLRTHVSFHVYHEKLLTLGKLFLKTVEDMPCRKEAASKKKIPPQPEYYMCFWEDCGLKLYDIQEYHCHVFLHVKYAKDYCKFAGCMVDITTCRSSHARVHTLERSCACPQCGEHFNKYSKLKEHLERQKEKIYECSYCMSKFAKVEFLRKHARGHISTYACQCCDMTSPYLYSLVMHIRYKHLGHYEELKNFHCHLCDYKAIQKSDLKRHLAVHEKRSSNRISKKKKRKSSKKETNGSNRKRFACHICPKSYCRGGVLSGHLVKTHGLQIPNGHSRFRYHIAPDGKYKLTQSRYESLEVSNQVIKRELSQEKELPINTELKVTLTDRTVRRPIPSNFQLEVDGPKTETAADESKKVLIEFQQLDEAGNITKMEVFESEILGQK